MNRWFRCLVATLVITTSQAKSETSINEQPPTSVASPSGENLPSSREERLKLARLAKSKALTPPQKSIFEKYAKSFDRRNDNSIAGSNFQGFYPRLDWIERGSGPAIGVRYWKPHAAGPVDVMGAAYYSWRRYQLYEMQIGLIPNHGRKIPSRSFEIDQVEQLGDVDRYAFSRFKLYANARYRDRTDQVFFGQGPDSKYENQARYRIKDTLAEAAMGFQFTRRIGYTFKAGFLQHSLARSRSAPHLDDFLPPPVAPPDISLPGSPNPPDYFRYHASFLLDFRDDPSMPHKGFLLAFGWEKFDNINTGNRFNFHRFGWDLRSYVPLGSRQQVIAFHATAIDSDPAPNNQVPFFLQPSLGGGESLRGYDAFRFQGDKLLLMQAEYRWEVSRRIELALFGDTGTVADHGERLAINKMKSDAGIGFRLKSSRATLFRLDVARSNEGIQFQYRFSAVF